MKLEDAKKWLKDFLLEIGYKAEDPAIEFIDNADLLDIDEISSKINSNILGVLNLLEKDEEMRRMGCVK